MADPLALNALLDATGSSIQASQAALEGGDVRSGTLALSEATVDMKTTFTRRADGTLGVEPVSATAATQTGLQSGLVSSVKVQYVAVAATQAATTRTPAPPAPVSVLTADQVRETVRAEMGSLIKIYRVVDIQPWFVPEAGRWLVLVKDSAGRVIRERVLVDAKGA